PRRSQAGSSPASGACCGSSRPRAVRFGLTLSLAELGPEAGTRLSPTAALLIAVRLHDDTTASSPERRPKTCERLAQTVLHPSSSTRSRQAAIRRRGKPAHVGKTLCLAR